MLSLNHPHLARTLERVRHEQILLYRRPHPSTGAPGYLARSRRDPTQAYHLTIEDGQIRCPCQKYLKDGLCVHAAALWQLLEGAFQPPNAPAPPPRQRRAPAPAAPSYARPRSAAERQRREAAARRDTAFPWRDDQDFSLFKQ